MNLEEIISTVEHETETVLDSSLVNSSFSLLQPNLQLAWDSTAYGDLKTCPTYYNYRHRLGYVPREENAHTIWGSVYQAGLETYDHSKAEGKSHDEAVLDAVRKAFILTFNKKLRRPWTSIEPTKTRETVIRAIIWHLDQYENDPLETLILSNSKPAVELSFRFPSGFVTESTKESFILCGHLDRAVYWNGHKRILDHKSTKGSIGANYFSKYSPDNQVSLYLIAGSVIFDEPVLNMIIDVVQTLVNGNKFQRGFVTRTQSQLDEWLRHFGQWMKVAERYAADNDWPQNDKACGMYSSYDDEHQVWKNGCPYRSVCGAPPELRQNLLDGLFEKRIWDPLQPR